jgi:hypothetical protein
MLVACRKIVDPVDPDGVDSVQFAPATAAADGSAVIALTVVDTIAPPSDKKVILTSSIGTFLGATATITVMLSDSGRGYAQLKAPSSAGTAIISATAAAVTKYFNVAFSAIPPTPVSKGITQLLPSATSELADAASLVTLKAVVDTAPRPAPFSVTFATTGGTLLGGSSPTTITVPVDDSGFARAQLRAPSDPSPVFVTATSGGVTRSVVVSFAPAPPNNVRLTGDFAVKAGAANSAGFTAQLLRAVGIPSPGVAISFSADIAGERNGTFGQFSPRTTVSTTPTVTTRFTAGETTYRGPVVVRVRAVQGATTVTDSVFIQIVAP